MQRRSARLSFFIVAGPYGPAMLVCKKKGNRSAAPHLWTIGPAYVRDVRGAGPLVQICGTAERLQAGRNTLVIALPGERLQKRHVLYTLMPYPQQEFKP